MSRFHLSAILLALAGLDYAALDDITTDTAASFAAEWAMLILSVPIAWLVIRKFRNWQRAGTPRV